MDKRMILYRGSLKSCNYHCSYCPFSKHSMSKRELERDQLQWFSFVNSLQEKAKVLRIGALMVVPYGEAMIHPWYWKGLAQISALAEMDAVGIQTNLSFSVSTFLDCYVKSGGVLDKLRLWATFHPEMTSVSEFAEKCRALCKQGVKLCAGSVGVPRNLNLLQELKQKLHDIYLWVNKMDGLRRPYTEREQEAFLEIDPYFAREFVPVLADRNKCRARLFVEGGGKLRTCNISSVLKTDESWEALNDFPVPECSRRQCSCYLAYGGREDFINQVLFGPYPLFRIPRCPKAVFLDIEGTLLPAKGHHAAKSAEVSASVMAGLEILARQKVPLFFATTLPYKKAMERCRKIRHLFAGGIFAGGAHLVLKHKKEYFYELKGSWLTVLSLLEKAFRCRVLTYQNQKELYKITLLRPAHSPWTTQEMEHVMDKIVSEGNTARCYIEGNCLQIVSVDAHKAAGVETICRWLNLSPKETVAVGDSKEDEGMMRLCNF